MNGSARTLSELNLAPHVIAQLEAEGVRSLADWRRLGSKRLRIFGVPTPLVRRLDQLAKEARASR